MYKLKYLKYKNKYFNLKQNGGGTLYIINSRGTETLKDIDDNLIKEIPIKSTSDIGPYSIIKHEDTYRVEKDGVDYGDNYKFEESLVSVQQTTKDTTKDTIKAKSVDYNIQRFIEAQNTGSYNGTYYGSTYEVAMSELSSGQKKTHWIWYCLPNILMTSMQSDASKLFSIKSFTEAVAYVNNDLLRTRLLNMFSIICDKLKSKARPTNAKILMDSDIDVTKLKSCVTLFYYAYEATTIDKHSTITDLYRMLGEDDNTIHLIKEEYNSVLGYKLR